MQSYREVLEEGQAFLKSAGIGEWSVDAWYLFEDTFGFDRMRYMLDGQEMADQERIPLYEERLKRRADHEPVQYILGQTEFMGMPFLVNEHVLIPRHDTEVLVEMVLSYIKGGEHILDMCTGSGCIILSLKLLAEAGIKGVGVDISADALDVARQNGRQLEADIEWIQSDLFTNVSDEFDMIVSNPPYIESDVIKGLMPEVKDHEPMLALDGEADGLAFYRRIVEDGSDCLRKNGMIFFEIGYNQGEALKKMLEAKGFLDIVVKKDLAGLDRVVYARKG